jgi:glycosyltransferase involved in cell wall biosynthesis
MQDRMRILSLSNHELLPHLGSGKTRLRWTEGLRRRGHDVTVVQPTDFEIFTRLRHGKKFRQAVGAFIKVGLLLRREKFDLIECYGDEFWLLEWYLKRSRGAPLIVAHADGLELLDMAKERRYFSRRSLVKDLFFRVTHERFTRIAFTSADKFVCGCRDDLQYAIDQGIFDVANAVQIRPGIDEIFLEQGFRETKEKKIAFIGSWIERKGIRVVPAVIERVLTDHRDYTFEVFGCFGVAPAIRACFPEHLRARVVIHPKYDLDELIEKVKECAIYFSPSYSEGFGLSTAEAMACSCAVVATPTGFCSELPEDTIVRVNFDDVDGMARSIAGLAADEPARLRIARAGHAWVQQCTWEPQVSRLESLYRSWSSEQNRSDTRE